MCRRSFARIHATNLKKQAILPLTFANDADYSKIGCVSAGIMYQTGRLIIIHRSGGDLIETVGLDKLLRGDESATISLKVTKKDGSSLNIPVEHTMSGDQIEWMKAGSALNVSRPLPKHVTSSHSDLPLAQLIRKARSEATGADASAVPPLDSRRHRSAESVQV